MRPWLGEQAADLLTNALHALESCGDATGEGIARDLRRFLEDDTPEGSAVMTPENDPRECGWMGCGHPRCAERCTGVPLDEWRQWRGDCDHQWLDRPESDSRQCLICGVEG